MTKDDLVARRHALGWTQKQAAAAFGVAPRTYQNWEANGRMPQKMVAAVLAFFEREPAQ